jgi:DNA modification methylase
MTVELHLGDCLEFLSTLPEEKYAVLTDPPYGIDAKTGWTKHLVSWAAQWAGGSIVNDKDTNMRDFVIAWAKDRNYPAAVFGSASIEEPKGYIARLIWDKGAAAGMGDLSIPWKPNYDFIHVFGRGWEGFRGSSILRANNIPRISMGRTHPHEKPVSLWAQILDKLPKDYIVIDPFMGTGGCGVACQRSKHRFIGIEITEAHFEIARQRIARAQMQPRLEGI